MCGVVAIVCADHVDAWRGRRHVLETERERETVEHEAINMHTR